MRITWALVAMALALIASGCGATVTDSDADAGSDGPVGDRAPMDAAPPLIAWRLPDGGWRGNALERGQLRRRDHRRV